MTYSQVGSRSELLKEELTRWQANYIDVNSLVLNQLELQRSVEQLTAENNSLRCV